MQAMTVVSAIDDVAEEQSSIEMHARAAADATMFFGVPAEAPEHANSSSVPSSPDRDMRRADHRKMLSMVGQMLRKAHGIPDT